MKKSGYCPDIKGEEVSQVKQIACAKVRGVELENASSLVWLKNSVSADIENKPIVAKRDSGGRGKE